MADLNWCKKQKRGLKIIEPNENLSKEYLRNAEETLEVLKEIKNKSNIWLATTKYYFEYFCAYSILLKVGIKSEIHDCTISFIKKLEEENIIPKYFSKILEDDKELRIDNQYYLKNINVSINQDSLTEYLLTTKETLNILTMDKINKARNLLI